MDSPDRCKCATCVEYSRIILHGQCHGRTYDRDLCSSRCHPPTRCGRACPNYSGSRRRKAGAHVERLHSIRVGERDGGLRTPAPAGYCRRYIKIEYYNYRPDEIVLLNFLDTIAIGIQQGLYDENLVYDHTNAIVQRWYDQLLDPNTAKLMRIQVRDYDRLCKLAQRWNTVEPRFGRRWWKWRRV